MALSPSLEALLLEHIREGQRSARRGALTVLVAMLGLAAVGFLAIAPPRALTFVAPAGIGVLVGLFELVSSLRDPTKSELLKRLRESSDRIVWLYDVIPRLRHHRASIMIGYDNRRRDRLTVAVGKEQEVLRAISALAPNAAIGFSTELEARFMKSPRDMRGSPTDDTSQT